MKFNSTHLTVFANRWRCVAILLASVCLVWVAFVSSSAQLKTQRQVTSLQLGEAGTGARVTIISDLALNDYEAFRRGDHFYVKIPAAEFAFSQPRFHGNGFDDVQVQKVGDGVVVSFKLQLGASAHVDQHGNRLDVIFTAPNRNQRNSVPILAANSVPSGLNQNSGINQSNPDRQRDASGPTPANTAQVSRARFANARPTHVSRPSRPPVRNVRTEGGDVGTRALNNTPVASSTSVHPASPTPVPSYPAGPTYAPATSTPTSSTNSKPAGVSANSPGWNQLRTWFSANRNAAMLGALILAALLVLAAVFLYRSRTMKVTASRTKRPLAQPKANKVELDELNDVRKERVPVAVLPINQGKKSEWSREVSQPRFAAPEVSVTRPAAFSKPSISAVAVADDEFVSEEREVFEL